MSKTGFVRDGFCPGWVLSEMGFVRDGFCPGGDMSGRGYVRKGFCPHTGYYRFVWSKHMLWYIKTCQEVLLLTNFEKIAKIKQKKIKRYFTNVRIRKCENVGFGLQILENHSLGAHLQIEMGGSGPNILENWFRDMGLGSELDKSLNSQGVFRAISQI